MGGAPNWIRERCRPWGSPFTPALATTREALLADMLARGIVAHLSCVDTRVLAPSGWGAGSMLAPSAICSNWRQPGLRCLRRAGEYHTMVTDGPGFAAPLTLGHWQVARQEHLAYLLEDEE